MPQANVLVMAKDRFVAALLGALVELSGRRAAFPLDNEESTAALRRMRPDLALVDCALGSAVCSELAASARDDGTRLLMVSAAHTASEARDIAGVYRAEVFVLPIRPREFADYLDRALAVAAS